MTKTGILCIVASAAAIAATPATAASMDFNFDYANSSISVSPQTVACLPTSGCRVTATKAASFPASLTIEEGASSSFTFANFDISAGIGGDSDARITATLAFLQPVTGNVTVGSTASYLRVGGFLTSGLTGGALTWDTPSTTLTTTDGSSFSVAFANLSGFQYGRTVAAPVTITVNNVSPQPEPATWATLVLGFGLAGWSIRRRSVKASTALA